MSNPLQTVITPPDDDPQLASYFASLSFVPPPNLVSASPYVLPFVSPDEHLDAQTIAASFQRFVHEATRDPPSTQLAPAFEHVVLTVRTAYLTALGAAKVAEILSSGRRENEKQKYEGELRRTNEKHAEELRHTNEKHAAEIEKQAEELRHTNDIHAAEIEKQAEELRHTNEKHTAEIEKQAEELRHTNEKHAAEIEKQAEELRHTKEKHAAEIEKHAAEINTSKLELDLTTKYLKSEIQSAKSQTKMLREEMSLARHRYIASNIEIGSIIRGSVTRRHSWQEAIKHGLKDQTLPILSPDGRITDEDVQDILDTTFQSEPEMYAPTTALFAKLLGRPRTESDPGVKVFNTHNRTVLPPYKPDLSICLDGSIKADATSIYVAIELKHVSKPLDDDAYGQVLDDLLVMHQYQPARSVLATLVSDLHVNHIVLLRIISEQEQQVVHYTTVSLATALTYIKQVLLSESSYRPPVPSFSLQLPPMERRLGHPKNSVVGEFKMPKEVLEMAKSRWPSERKTLGTTMAVKVLVKNIPKAAAMMTDTERLGIFPDHSQELMIYHLIQSQSSPSEYIAKLVYESEDGEELGIVPVGKSIDLRGISDHFNLSTILSDVLYGIQWLHSLGIMHRDIRRDNIIVVNEAAEGAKSRLRGKIIDFGASIVRPPGATCYPEQDYVGGYICCPRDLIGNIRTRYTPEPQHDLLAWVMLVNFVVFPNGVPFLHSQLVATPSAEADKLTQYWDRLIASGLWGPFVAEAEANQPDVLRRLMFDLIVML